MADFQIHAIAVIKNEGDVVEHCLREAARWADYIYVYDGVSTDGTWETVQAMNHPRIIPWRQDAKPFSEGLRAEVFAAFRHQSREGDWWVHLNADEFYIDDPRQYLPTVPARYHVVWGTAIEYYITERDLECVDFARPTTAVLPDLRYYRAFFREARFFRYRRRLAWDTTDAWPRHVGLVYPQQIRFKHYPYRSPQQIQMRLDVRRDNRARGFTGWDYAKEASWKEKIVPAATLHHDRGDGAYQIDEDRLPPAVEPLGRRMVKRLMHGLRIWP